tara:strand:+ start:2488 stop:2625 length:138 start_codon:yes stop_codon:yes gene_type:complete
MKECCKTGNKGKTKSRLQRWLNYVVYAVLTIIIIGAIYLQIIGNK